MGKCSTLLNEGHGLKEKVCHKVLSKIIILAINGKIIKIMVLVGIVIGNNSNKVGKNLRKVGNNLSKVGSNLSRARNNLNRVGNNPKIGITNLVNKP